MQSLPRVLLVALIFFAQIWAGMHAVEHAAGRQDTLPAHVCEFCLAAHDLGAALTSVAALPCPEARFERPAVLPLAGRSALPPPLASQRAPPLS